ncbi:MAG: hypothetical protein APR54_06375 [Candidatus Cloacimonas sp. SDB]|nr:MAG: hypothetical protein APR54_06375 [Candidatus Cloacimonas sp. SDB]
MKLYLLNALITPFEVEENEMAVFVVQKLSKEKFIEIFQLAVESKAEVISSIGHQSTAEFLKQILPDNLKKFVSHQRIGISIEEGDLALIFRITERAEKIQEWTLDDLQDFYSQGKIEFLTLSRVYMPEMVFNPANFFSEKEDRNEC